jgi:DNA (cytosine-5)-methyltransferase 1
VTFKTLDLFCGMGGLSWGLKKTGAIESVWAVDNHESALALYKRNMPETHTLLIDLSKRDQVGELLSKIVMDGGVDLVVGGSPCRGFTRIRNGQDIYLDPNNQLAIRYAEIVRALNPPAFIYENVPELQNSPIFRKFLGKLRGRQCYRINYAVVEAANFGNPSRRRRLLVVGLRWDIGKLPIVPMGLNISHQKFWLHREEKDKPTYYQELDELSSAQLNDPSDCTLVSVEQAISDLPILTAGTSGIMRAYRTKSQSAYQAWARQGLEETDGHAVPYLQSATRMRLEAIGPGGNWRDLPKELTYKVPFNPLSGELRRTHYSAYRRLFPKGHSPTVQGHADFAYHYSQERALTPREFARLMGLTDDFLLGHNYQVAIEAIGNAVPPLLAEAVAIPLVNQLSSCPW